MAEEARSTVDLWIEGQKFELTLDDAVGIVKNLNRQIREARLTNQPEIELWNSRVMEYHLRNMFKQIYPDDTKPVYWSRRVMQVLLREWYCNRMNLDVWCIYCSRFVKHDESCRASNRYHSVYGYDNLSITAESILREMHKYRPGRRDGEKTVVNLDHLVNSLQQASV